MAAKFQVLVVSRDPALLGFLPRQLQEAGYHVMTAGGTDGELKVVLESMVFDFAVVDIMMPELEGIEVSLRIRQRSQVPVLMLSAWGAGEDKVRGLDLLAESYLTEPFGIDGVVQRIRAAAQRNAVSAGIASYARSGSL